MRRWYAVGVAAMALCASARAEDWPAWRGPRGDGTSMEANVPVQWSATQNVAWKVSIPGKGHSSPIVHSGRVYVTSCVEERKERILLALDARDGKTLWQRVVLSAPLEKRNNLNSYASGTPATDGKSVFVTFLDAPNVQVVRYGADGNEVWRRSPGKFTSIHGFCSSVLPYKDMVIVNADQDAVGEDRAYIVALEQATGKERWRIDRPNRVRSYCPPVVFEAAGKPQMVLSGSRCVASYDPDTGKRHWIIDGPTEQFVASLVFTDGTFMITGGYPTLHIMGIRPDGSGNVTNTHVLWHERKTPAYVPSPIAAGKHFFLVSDDGIASCLEAATGKRMWQEKLSKHFSASPVSAGGLLYFLDDAGTTHVLKAGPTFEVVARNALGEECRGSPAVSGGRIFLRGVSNLYCIGPSGQTPAR
jgi:hypothetical protein